MGIKSKHKKRISAVTILCVSLAAAIFFIAAIGFGFAIAGSPVSSSDVFGIGSETTSINTTVGVIMAGDDAGPDAQDTPRSKLANDNHRDISKTMQLVKLKKEEEAKAAAEAARIDEMIHIQRAKENRQKQINSNVGMPEGLSEINWDQGKAAFLAEWTTKINKYLERSPLENYGEKFATMAWEYGIDPRWSPAISNTESSKGLYCFVEHNAWGWGHTGWPTWDEAIQAHIKGLQEGYGYTVSKPYAMKYCPPNHENWYNNTIREMIKMS